MTTCANCGAGNPAGQRFCGDCGSPLAASCPTCGAENPPGQRFCGDCGTELVPAAAAAVQPPREAAVSERRLVTVLFADLVGFTQLSESRDAEEVRELLSRYFEIARRLVGLYGGTVEKFIGDAVMAVWGTPVATEDDAERAVRAGLDLIAAVSALGDDVGAADLRARAGVLTGEAAVTLGADGQGMVAGDLVNTASRIQAAAEPGSLLVGEATRRSTEQTIVFEDAGEHELKGKAQAVPLWRAKRVVSGRGGQLKSGGLEAPFVGRERELRQVKDLFHAAADGKKAHLVSVTGIAGIGKSRLGWEFYKYFDGIVEPIWWHRGRCLSYGEGVTYWALADMVRMRCRLAEDEDEASALAKLRATLDEHLIDEAERAFVEAPLAQLLGIGSASAEPGDRQQLFAAWRLFFERLADSNPVVLVFEDLQWADGSLLDFIEYLLEWSRNHPLFVVTLARPEVLERRPTWGAGQRAFTSMYLEPLTRDAMEELLDGLVPGLPTAVREQILARAEGVPLYAVETVRMLLDRGLLQEEGSAYRVVGEVGSLEVPETLHALIAARLDGLSEAERSLLQDAAVLGKTFSLRVLAGVNGAGESALEPLLASLVRKEVLSLQADPRSPEHGQYGFLQDLVRRVAYETLARRDRKARHLAAAEHLADAIGQEEIPEVIASHLVAAFEAAPDADDAEDLRARAALTFALAGERASALAAAGEAQRYYEQAAELSGDPTREAEWIDRAGQMATTAGRPDEAGELLGRARASYEAQGNVVGAALVDAKLADIDFLQGHPPVAARRMAPALEAIEREGSEQDVAVLAAQLGRFLIFTGEYDAAMPHLERALALAEAHGLTETFAQALNSKSVLMGRTHRPREARILIEGALAVTLDHDLHAAALRAYNNLVATMWQADEWRGAIEAIDRALTLARRIGDRRWEMSFLAGSVGSLGQLGRWDEALARAAEARERATTEFARGLMLAVSQIYCRRGELGPARELMTQHADVASSENADFAAGYASLEAGLLAAEGRIDEALEAARRSVSFHDAGPPSWVLFNVLELADFATDETTVRELLALLDSAAVTEITPAVHAQAARLRARLPEHDAEQELLIAERIFRDLEAPFHVAVVQLQRAERLPTDEAEPLLAEARETFERLRATPWLERLATQPQPELRATT
jgi:class 3 adenylate cyclase/tetratricopeptide (TPR) repeat protein